MPKTQRLDEWLHRSGNDLQYFRNQFAEPYQSTIAFSDWLLKLGCFPHGRPVRVLDLGAGMGETLAYMAPRFKSASFSGLEINKDLVREGNERLKQSNILNARLESGDLYKIPARHRGKFQGIVSLQTLSWLPDFQEAILKMIALDAEWIAITSLFFEGDVNAKIQIQDYTIPTKKKPFKEAFYNVYSLPLVRRLFAEHHYECRTESFQIQKDLPKSSLTGMSSYTRKLDSGERLLFSGPLWLHWYFVLARRSAKKNKRI